MDVVERNRKRILTFSDKLKPIFQKLGIEYTVMRKILQVKITMDGRRVPTIRMAKTIHIFIKPLH